MVYYSQYDVEKILATYGLKKLDHRKPSQNGYWITYWEYANFSKRIVWKRWMIDLVTIQEEKANLCRWLTNKGITWANEGLAHISINVLQKVGGY